MKRQKLVSILALTVGALSLYVALMQALGAFLVAYDVSLVKFLQMVAMPTLAAVLAASSWFRNSHRSGAFLLVAAIACLATAVFGREIYAFAPV